MRRTTARRVRASLAALERHGTPSPARVATTWQHMGTSAGQSADDESSFDQAAVRWSRRGRAGGPRRGDGPGGRGAGTGRTAGAPGRVGGASDGRGWARTRGEPERRQPRGRHTRPRTLAIADGEEEPRGEGPEERQGEGRPEGRNQAGREGRR